MCNRNGSWLLAVLLIALVHGPAAAGPGEHVDEELRFKIRYPGGWKAIPIPKGERWILAKYVSQKSYRPKKIGEWDFMLKQHKPRMLIIRLPAKSYADFHQYLESNGRDGFYLVERERGELHGTVVDRLEFKIEKKTVPRRLIVWVYHREKERIAVEFEVLEDRYRELGPSCRKALKTFRFLTSEGEESPSAPRKTPNGRTYALSKIEDRAAWRKLPADVRRQYRKRSEQERLSYAKSTAPKNWFVRETDHFLILSQHTPSFTKKTIRRLEACAQFLDEHFGDLSDEYVRRAIVRVFRDQGSYNAHKAEARGSADHEIVIHEDFKTNTSSGSFLGGAVDYFLKEKMGRWWGAGVRLFPEWLDEGFDALRYGSMRGKDLELWIPRDYLREARKEKVIVTAQVLMNMTRAEADRRGYEIGKLYDAQARALFIYLTGKGAKVKHLKGFLVRYMQRAATLGEQDEWAKHEREKIKAKEKKGELSGEDLEKAKRKARHLAAELSEAEKIKRLNDEMCAWTDRQWRSLQRGYASVLR